jgi:hypothetical protein
MMEEVKKKIYGDFDELAKKTLRNGNYALLRYF